MTPRYQLRNRRSGSASVNVENTSPKSRPKRKERKENPKQNLSPNAKRQKSDEKSSHKMDAELEATKYGSAVEAKDRLSTLPEELIDNICSYLSARRIRELRLTCRGLRPKVDHQFVVAHFQTSQFMLTRESLQLLINTAKDNRLGPRVKELQICLVTFAERKRASISGEPTTNKERDEEEAIIAVQFDQDGKDEDYKLAQRISVEEQVQRYRRTLRRKRRRMYGMHQTSQATIRKQGIDAEMLAEALRSLPSLESISLIDQLNSDSPPWGARKLRDEIGMWPPTAFRRRKKDYHDWYGLREDERDHYLQFLTNTFAITLGAIIKSGVKLKDSFAIEGALWHFAVPKTPTSRRLRPAGTPGKTFAENQVEELKPAFSELKSLSLHTYNYYSYDAVVITHDSPMDWLHKYIPLWPAIQSLSIGGANLEREKHIFEILSGPTVRFQHLRNLNIEYMCFHTNHLTKLLHNHLTTLHHFRTYNCSPYGGHYYNVLKALFGSPAMVSMELDMDGVGPFYWQAGQILTGLGKGIMRLELYQKKPTDFQAVLDIILTTVQLQHQITPDVAHTNEEYRLYINRERPRGWNS